MIIQELVGDNFFFPTGVSGHNNALPRHIFMMAALHETMKKAGQKGVRLLEVGSWCGNSAVIWAEGLRRFTVTPGAADASVLLCVDAWAPYISLNDLELADHYRKMDASARSGAAFDVFRHNLDVASRRFGIRADFLKGPSPEALESLRSDFFDLVFIDGSHYYENVLADLKSAIRLVKDGGYISGDDLELQYAQVDQEFARNNLRSDYIVDPKTGEAYHPGVARAVHECFGSNVSLYHGFWIMKRVGKKFVPVALDQPVFFFPSHMDEEAFRYLAGRFGIQMPESSKAVFG